MSGTMIGMIIFIVLFIVTAIVMGVGFYKGWFCDECKDKGEDKECPEETTCNDDAIEALSTLKTIAPYSGYDGGRLTPTAAAAAEPALACADRCDNEPECIGFSYVFNPDSGEVGSCYTKTSGATAAEMTSNVTHHWFSRGTIVPNAPVGYTMKYKHHRAGSGADNYQDTKPEECAVICDADPECKGISYVHGDVSSDTGACYVKAAGVTDLKDLAPSETHQWYEKDA